MKKHPITTGNRKLRITTETLRRLSNADLSRVAGGALFPSQEGPNICASRPKICWQWPEPYSAGMC